MHHLGATRSSLKHDHLLQTPDTFVRTPLPGATGVEFIVHAAPQLGAAFTQMTAEFAAGGTLGPAPAQRFIYVLEGELELTAPASRTLSAQAASPICPQGTAHQVRATAKARSRVIEKTYRADRRTQPHPQVVIGNESSIADVAADGRRIPARSLAHARRPMPTTSPSTP